MMNFLPILISPTSNGIIVKVGCVKLVYQQTQLDMFHSDLAYYLNNPIAAEEEIRKRWHIEQGEDAESPEEATDERAPEPARSIAEPTAKKEKSAEAPR